MVGGQPQNVDLVNPSCPENMNFLAHIYLSGSNPDVLLGNFMGDQVKGRDLSRFSPGVRTGLQLHRRIDHFTDTHSLTREARKLLQPSMRKYAGVVLDVFYDHFLATSWTKHHHLPLEEFVQDAYDLIERRSEELPERTRFLFGYMKEQDWLGNYVEIDGIERALQGLSRRAVNGAQMAHSKAELLNNYDVLSNNFDVFFPLIKEECKHFLNKVSTN